MKKLVTIFIISILFSTNLVLAQPKPENGISGISILPYFQWTASGAYFLQISTSDDFSTDFMEIDVNTLTEYQVTESGFADLGYSPLDNNTKYYWRIADASGAGANNIEPAVDSYFFTTVSNINITLSNPDDGTDIYPFTTVQFSWYLGSSVGSLKFYLQIISSASLPTALEWETPDFAFDNLGNTSKSVSGLTGGTKYFWRVIVYFDDGSSSGSFDVDDRVVKFSAVYEFDTQGGAVKAYPSWPVGGNIIYNLQPTYYWYTMQYDEDATFEVYVVEDGNNIGDLDKLDDDGVLPLDAGSDTYISQVTDLDPSTTYLWQVKTINGAAVNYSDIAEFTTYDAPGIVPTKPTLSYPTDNITIYTTSPTMYWYIEAYNSGTLTFEVFVDDGGGFVSMGTTADTYLQISGLTPGTDYQWKVSSTDGVTTIESDIEEFSVAGGMGSTVVLNWPVGNPLIYTNTPTLSWYVEGSTLGWDSFIVKWNKDIAPGNWAGATTGSYQTADINETYYEIDDPLTYGSTYYWGVALYDGVTLPSHSDYEFNSFTLAGGNAVIEQTNPENNSIVYTTKPTFYWYVSGSALGIDKYKVTYSNTSLFTVYEEIESITTNAEVIVDLQPGATYWWYVSVSYDGGSSYSIASSTWQFTVDPGASAVVPIAASPARGVTIDSDSPMLSWYLPAQSESQLTYEVEVADNAEFSSATVYDNLAQLNAQLNDLDEGNYFWRVRSKTNSESSSYSTPANFKIGSVTSIENDEELKLSYNLEQNYPNPFNPVTTIKYSLPEVSFVTIKIYDMLGREVKTLINQEVTAGNHKLTWKGDNNYGHKVSSGTYLYRITAGNFTEVKKMVLLK